MDEKTTDIRMPRYAGNSFLEAVREEPDMADIEAAIIEGLAVGFHWEPLHAPVFIRLTHEQMVRAIPLLLEHV